jgi:hypothetical protein
MTRMRGLVAFSAGVVRTHKSTGRLVRQIWLHLSLGIGGQRNPLRRGALHSVLVVNFVAVRREFPPLPPPRIRPLAAVFCGRRPVCGFRATAAAHRAAGAAETKEDDNRDIDDQDPGPADEAPVLRLDPFADFGANVLEESRVREVGGLPQVDVVCRLALLEDLLCSRCPARTAVSEGFEDVWPSTGPRFYETVLEEW